MKRYSPRSLTPVRTLFVTAALVFAATPVVAQKIETGFLDRAVVVNKTEYRYQVFVPREFTRSKPGPSLSFCTEAVHTEAMAFVQPTAASAT